MTYIYANTLEELQAKSIGKYHDHLEEYYFGLSKDAPKRINTDKNKGKYCFVYKDY